MGIILEDVMNNNYKPLSETDEIMAEMSDIILEDIYCLVDALNEEYFITESQWDDLKIKKEDLIDPEKIKSLIKRINKEQNNFKIKDLLLDTLLAVIIGLAGYAPASAIGFLIVKGKLPFCLFTALPALIGMFFGTLFSNKVIDGMENRFPNIISKTKKAIKRVEKSIKKEKDPKNKKVFEDQLKALKQNLEKLEDASMKTDIKNGKGYLYS